MESLTDIRADKRLYNYKNIVDISIITAKSFN